MWYLVVALVFATVIASMQEKHGMKITLVGRLVFGIGWPIVAFCLLVIAWCEVKEKK